MGQSRSLADSGGHLAQLIMIACLLSTPSLNAIPLPSLSSIPNHNSHIHSIPHLSKRMEISTLHTLGMGAKNPHTAPVYIKTEEAVAALPKFSSAEDANKAGAAEAGVFPPTHDHPSTLHHPTGQDDLDVKIPTPAVRICLITLVLLLLTSLTVFVISK